MSDSDKMETSKSKGDDVVKRETATEEGESVVAAGDKQVPEENGKKSDSSPEEAMENKPKETEKPSCPELKVPTEGIRRSSILSTDTEESTMTDKTLESTMTDKTPDATTEMAVQGVVVGSLTQEFKRLSPKKIEEEASEESPKPTANEPSPTVSEATLPASSDTEKESDRDKTPEQEVRSPPRMGPLLRKKSPLKNIMDKCRDFLASTKRGGERDLVPSGATAESTQSRPTSLELPPSEGISKPYDLDRFLSMFDKTKAFFQRKASQLMDQDSFSSDSSSEARHYLDTPSSGCLGDVSSTTTPTLTPSSSLMSAESFDDPKSKMPRLDSTVVVPKQPATRALDVVKSEEADETGQGEPSRRKTPPVQRQQRVQEKSPEEPDVDSKMEQDEDPKAPSGSEVKKEDKDQTKPS